MTYTAKKPATPEKLLIPTPVKTIQAIELGIEAENLMYWQVATTMLVQQ